MMKIIEVIPLKTCLFFVHLNFKFNWHPVFLFANSGNLTSCPPPVLFAFENFELFKTFLLKKEKHFASMIKLFNILPFH